MLLSFWTDRRPVNCCHLSVSKNTGKPRARTPSRIEIFPLNCYLIPSGVDRHRRDRKPYKGKGIGILQKSRTERRLLETDTSVTEAFKEGDFQVDAFKPICFLSVLLTVLPQSSEGCLSGVITQPRVLGETSGYLGNFPHTRRWQSGR